MPRLRGPRADLAAARDELSPVLLDGDAIEVAAALDQYAYRLELPVVWLGRDPVDGVRCPVAVLAIRGTGRLAAIRHATDVLQRVESHLMPDAVVVVVAARPSTRVPPGTLQRRLSAEILYQVRAAVSPATPRSGRSLRLRIGLSALSAVGLRVFRLALSAPPPDVPQPAGA